MFSFFKKKPPLPVADPAVTGTPAGTSADQSSGETAAKAAVLPTEATLPAPIPAAAAAARTADPSGLAVPVANSEFVAARIAAEAGASLPPAPVTPPHEGPAAPSPVEPVHAQASTPVNETGVATPAATFSNVDFPQPVGPTTDTNSPGATVRDTSLTAVYRWPGLSRATKVQRIESKRSASFISSGTGRAARTRW